MNYFPLCIFAVAVVAFLLALQAAFRTGVSPSKLPISLLAVLSFLLCGQKAGAAVIIGSIQEPFNYPDGTVFAAGALNGGTGWNANGSAAEANLASSAWGLSLVAGTAQTATVPGLTYTTPGYTSGTANRLTLDAAIGNATQNTGRALGQTIDSGTTYFSLLMSKNTPDTIRTINLAFFNGATERFAVGQIGTATGNTGGNIGLLMNNSNPGGLVFATTPIAMGTGITHLLIGRIDWDAAANETVSLWVDPANATSEAAAGPVYVSTNAFELTAITHIRPFTGNNATITGFNGNAVSANFDEIRMGGTWQSVVTAVPEPSTATLSLLVMASLGFVRRNRSAKP